MTGLPMGSGRRVLPPRPPVPPAPPRPSRLSSLVHDHGPHEGRGLDCPERLMGACIRGTLEVDGVVYDAEKIRELVREKYKMATEIIELRDKLRRAGRHLQLRTAALTRVIAREREGLRLEWRHGNASGGGSIHGSRRAAELAEAEYNARRENRTGYELLSPISPESTGIWCREVADWRRP